MKRAAFAFLLVAVAACDPGPMPDVPVSLADAELRKDWFPSASYNPYPLDDAVRSGQVDEVRHLLDRGADPNQRWSQSGDWFPLREALDTEGRSAVNQTEIVRLLLAHGADPNARWCPFGTRGPWSAWSGRLRCRSAKGMTALIYASIRGERDLVDMLLRAGAIPDTEDWSGRSVLDHTNDDVIFELVSRAMFPDAGARDRNALAWLDRHFKEPRTPEARTTPLSRALSSERWGDPHDRSRLRIVLSLEADPNERTGNHRTPLSIALETSFTSVRSLLEHGADVNQRWCELTPQDTKADPDCATEKGITPLMWAARAGRTQLVTLLLEWKADQSLKDWQGRSVLHYASTREVWDLLKAH